ncbi:MAG: hypothetical protein O6922_00155 [Chloroflexi bacterium]|nr:hypothetical protein [Chloroflexota bacterium]
MVQNRAIFFNIISSSPMIVAYYTRQISVGSLLKIRYNTDDSSSHHPISIG